MTTFYLQDKMIHKRPYIDDSQEVAYKHPRQWEDTSHFASVVDDIHPNSAHQNPQISGTTMLYNLVA